MIFGASVQKMSINTRIKVTQAMKRDNWNYFSRTRPRPDVGLSWLTWKIKQFAIFCNFFVLDSHNGLRKIEWVDTTRRVSTARIFLPHAKAEKKIVHALNSQNSGLHERGMYEYENWWSHLTSFYYTFIELYNDAAISLFFKDKVLKLVCESL